jgi:hypothetical protein
MRDSWVGAFLTKEGIAMTISESEEQPMKPEPDAEPAKPDIERPRELTPEEREELRKKIEEAKKTDPNIYPVF